MTTENNSAGKARALTLADINEITQKIYETEGAQAADTAFQRMAREFREAREAAGIFDKPDDPYGLGDLDAHIAAIQSGAVEAPEVIEHLELLDAAPEATASDKRRAADAAHKTNMGELEALCDAIESGTIEAPEIVEDFPDLDAAPEATASAAAPDDKSHEAVAKAESSVAATPSIASATAPVDLERPDPVVEHVGELDPSSKAAVENLMAREASYEDPPNKPTARTVEIRKYQAKQPKRDAARPAACEEFGIDPKDPMALHKVRTAYNLKTVGKTLADLENFHPGFWALPLETDDWSPSRKLVLSRFLWRRNDETKAKGKAAERQKKRAAKGYPADYDEKTPAERKRITNRLAKKWSRKRKALKAAGPSA